MAETPRTDPRSGALLIVELELMRNPSIARLNAGQRQAMARNILDALDAKGLIADLREEQGITLQSAA